MNDEHPIPVRLNLLLVAVVTAGLLGLMLATIPARGALPLAGIAVAYALLMNTGYALLHEAEHGMLHPDRRMNDGCGALLGLFFPAPFHLIRQGHIGHHLRNRSDDEAFDLYFEGENPVWKRLQFFGILTGLFWVVIVLSNLLAAASPAIIRQRPAGFDRPTAAFQKSLNPGYERLVRIEAFAVIGFYAFLIFVAGVPAFSLAVLLASFGFLWSTLQYVHHFGTVRDVLKGAKNLKTFGWLDALWLNHNWHLNHHMSPTTPWVHLPFLFEGRAFRRGGLWRSYVRMWRGPRFSEKHVENRHKGEVVR